MKFQMTQQDLDGGVPNNGLFCPVANTINRTCGLKAGNIFIATTAVWNNEKVRVFPMNDFLRNKYMRRLPDIVSNWVLAYDKSFESADNQPVSPIEFELPVDCDWFQTVEALGLKST